MVPDNLRLLFNDFPKTMKCRPIKTSVNNPCLISISPTIQLQFSLY